MTSQYISVTVISIAAAAPMIKWSRRLDYEDFLRQRGLPLWPSEHETLRSFKAWRCATLREVIDWEKEEEKKMDKHGQARTNRDEHQVEHTSVLPVFVRDGRCQSVFRAALLANAALSLLNLCCYLLDRQIASQAAVFESEGGFTERLYRIRSQRKENRCG